MIHGIKKDAQARMQKSMEALSYALSQIRTGKAHPSILGNIMVSYYGVNTPLSVVANITIKDSRTLQVVVFERHMLEVVNKAIQGAGLNLNPNNLGELLLISMPALTEETRKCCTKQARSAAEYARVAVRNIRRDALGDFKKLVKDKKVSEDEERRAISYIDKLTKDAEIQITKTTEEKEKDLMAV
ncbi:ribosome recycling factor [Candidatus Pseudomonas adelgestsugas]|uniref:Ribosome-recycling factor n=1 Tax=Candidatus Pseudomonas adelgestsugas TaxID=1302376 RepID=A0ABX5R9I7_9PSED|nr:ribosome recycling factor [Candidatus Pseudomonas adelgestsugas]QAX82087.1 Ribosome-recycling factor [Candidatus Pseudomonas adelgestsugas]